MIGNALNSLPIAYAPLSGSGQNVSYRVASMDSESSMSATGTVVSSAVASMDSESIINLEATRMAHAAMSVMGVSGLSSIGVILADGSMAISAVAAMSAFVSGSLISGVSSLSVTSDIVAEPQRVRDASCDFKSLYIAPGSVAIGGAFNSGALGGAAINALSGQAWRTFISTLTAEANVSSRAAVEMSGASNMAPTGSLYASGVGNISALAEITAIANVFFDSNASLAALASIEPLAMAHRKAAGTFETVISGLTGNGMLVAGGNASLDVLALVSPSAGAIYAGESSMPAVLVISPVPTAVFGFFAAMEMSSELVPVGIRDRIGETVMPGLSTFGGPAWEAVTAIVSTVYAAGWNLGVNAAESIVYRVAPEDIVYLVAPESIVYGQLE